MSRSQEEAPRGRLGYSLADPGQGQALFSAAFPAWASPAREWGWGGQALGIEGGSELGGCEESLSLCELYVLG